MKSRISVSYLTYRYLTKQAPVFVSICNLVIVIVSNRGKTDITARSLLIFMERTCVDLTFSFSKKYGCRGPFPEKI